MEATQVANSRQKDTEIVIHMYMIYKYIYIIYIYIYVTQPQKGWNSVTYSNVNGYREYYTWWNKSDLEKQMLYNISQSWNLKNNISKYIPQNKKTHE